MTNAFLEKIAYDYDHERRQLEREHEARSVQPKESRGAKALAGAGLGLALGAGLGYVAAHGRVPMNPLISAGVGAALGTAAGALSGFAQAMNNNLNVDESQGVMDMPDEDRAAYLKAVARKKELDEIEKSHWDRAHFQARRSDLRRFYAY